MEIVHHILVRILACVFTQCEFYANMHLYIWESLPLIHAWWPFPPRPLSTSIHTALLRSGRLMHQLQCTSGRQAACRRSALHPVPLRTSLGADEAGDRQADGRKLWERLFPETRWDKQTNRQPWRVLAHSYRPEHSASNYWCLGGKWCESDQTLGQGEWQWEVRVSEACCSHLQNGTPQGMWPVCVGLDFSSVYTNMIQYVCAQGLL